MSKVAPDMLRSEERSAMDRLAAAAQAVREASSRLFAFPASWRTQTYTPTEPGNASPPGASEPSAEAIERIADALESRSRRQRRSRRSNPTGPVLPADCAWLVAELERLTEERIDVPTDGRTPAATRYMLQRRLAEEKCRRDGKRPGVLGLYLVALDRIEPEIRGAMPEPTADRELSSAEWTRQAARCANSWARKGRDAAKRTSIATKTPKRVAR